MVGIGIASELDVQLVKMTRSRLLATQIVNGPSGYRIERAGACCFGEDCMERLTSVEEPDPEHPFYCWELLYRLNGRYMMWNIMGHGLHADFESTAKEIISSLILLEPGEATPLPISPQNVRRSQAG